MSIYSNGTLWLFGDVGSFEGGDHFTATMVRDALAAHGIGPLAAIINSGGGYCYEGVAIHNMLKRHPATVTVIIDGVAASAGSLIAMAGDEIVVRRGSTIMLHDPSSPSHGTAADHQRSFQSLDKIANEMAEIYAARSGKSVAEVRKLMVAETWLSGADAVAQGFADRVDTMEARAVARFDYSGVYQHPPSAITQGAGKATLRHAMAVTNWEAGGRKGPRPVDPARPASGRGLLVDMMRKRVEDDDRSRQAQVASSNRASIR